MYVLPGRRDNSRWPRLGFWEGQQRLIATGVEGDVEGDEASRNHRSKARKLDREKG